MTQTPSFQNAMVPATQMTLVNYVAISLECFVGWAKKHEQERHSTKTQGLTVHKTFLNTYQEGYGTRILAITTIIIIMSGLDNNFDYYHDSDLMAIIL